MAEKKPRASNLNHAANVLQSLLQNSKLPLAEQFIRWRLWSSWEQVVGQEIASHTLPVGYLNGTLYVWVNSSARMQELTFLVKPLKDKINNFAGKNWAKYIRFTLDKKAVPQPQEDGERIKDFIDSTES